MCQAKKPRISQPGPAEKAKPQFVTPDQLAGQNQEAGIGASREGRNALRIDRGSDPSMAGITPVENDQVRDFPAEEAEAGRLAAKQAEAFAQSKKDKRKRKFNQMSRMGQSGASIIIRNAVSGEKTTKDNIGPTR